MKARRAAAAPGDSQERIVRATYRLVSARGVHRVSLEEIAAAAGVSKGLVLYHFRSRDRLLLATMRWVLDEVADRIRSAALRAPTARAKVTAMLDVIFAGAESNRRYYLTYLEMIEHAARVDRYAELAPVLGNGGIQDETYAEVVRAGVDSGEFRPGDAAETATVVRGLVEGLFLRWLQEPGWREAYPRYRALAERAVLAYLLP